MARKPHRLRDFKQTSGLSDEGIAALLRERIGRDNISAATVRMRLKSDDSRIARSWQEALDLPELPAEDDPWRRGQPTDDDDGGPQERGKVSRLRAGDREPPEPSPDAPRAKTELAAVPDELDWRSAREAIISIYVTIGAGVAQIRRRPQIAEVFQQGAPVLADDWIRLARVDARTRAVLAKLLVVGPGGQLAMDHLILVGKLISLGKPDGTAGAGIPTAEEFAAATAAPNGAEHGGPGPAGGVGQARGASTG